ncbi:MAG: ATP-binding protein [Paludibacteraceae bacterium]|nr:ATP-binding protein [Paludibacteraceae bacterium]
MSKPFVFGKAVGDANFIGRERECERLAMNFTHGVNTILMSPRRWGKTSIVQRMIASVKSQSLLVVFFDAFYCRNEYDFCNKLRSIGQIAGCSYCQKSYDVAKKPYLCNIRCNPHKLWHLIDIQ